LRTIGAVSVRALLALLLLLVSPALATAQDDMSSIRGRPRAEEPAPSPAPEPEWQPHYREGVRAFDAGDLERALSELTRAYELGGPPALARNMAVTLERLGRRQDAIASYQRYLTLVPDASDRVEIEARITALAAPASRRDPAPPVLTLIEPPATTTEPVVYASPPIDDRPEPVVRPGPEWVVSWVFLGLTAASAGGAAIAYAVGSSQFDQLRADCIAAMGCTEGEIAEDPSHTSATAANVLWVTTGILGAVTVASFIIEGLVSANPPRRTYISGGALELALDLGPGSFRLRGTF
jgi:hypothetical protein